MSSNRGETVYSPSLRLLTEIAGLTLKSPLMLASGALGVTAPLLKRALDAGAGAVVTKSISLEPRAGYRNPTVVEVDCGYLNAIGLANPGAEYALKELSPLDGRGLPIIASVFGSTPEDFRRVVSFLNESCAVAFELNLSCPHVPGVGVEVGQDPAVVSELVKAAKKSTSKPLFVKLSPNVTDIVSIARAAEEAGADALTAINTVRAMAIDIEAQRPILSNVIGGLSGPAMKPIALRCVYEVSKAGGIPVVGCGGVVKWQDAVEFFLAGASAVQMATAVAYHDMPVFRGVAEGVGEYLAKRNYRSVKEIVGLSHAH